MTQKETIPQTNPLFYERLQKDFFDSLPSLPQDAETLFSYNEIQDLLSRFFKGKKESTGHYRPGLLAPNENLLIREIDNYVEYSNASTILTAYTQTPTGKTSFLAQAIENNCPKLVTYLTHFHTQEQKDKALVAFVPQQDNFHMGNALCSYGANPNYIPDYNRLGLKNTKDTVLFLYLNDGKNKRLPYLDPNEINPLSNFWKRVDLTHKNTSGKTLLTLACQKGTFVEKRYGAPALLEAICKLPDKNSFDNAIAYEKTYSAIIKRIPNDDWDKGIYDGYTTPGKRDFAKLIKDFLKTLKTARETYSVQPKEIIQTTPKKIEVKTEPEFIQSDLFSSTPEQKQPLKISSASDRKETQKFQPELPGMERF